MAPAALDFLSRIEPTEPTGFGGLHPLTFDYVGGWTYFAPALLTRHHHLHVIDVF
jgi:hypothetical protein